jgi:hypothetical protein
VSSALKDPSWQKVGKWAAWVNAVCYIGGAALFLLVDLEVTWTAASYVENQPVLDRLTEFFAAERDAWPQVLTYTVLFAVGFLALIPIGFTLREYLGRELATSQMVAASFLAAGVIGAVGQLAFAGGRSTILEASQECLDCEGLEGLLVSLNSSLVMLDGIAEWVGLGFFLLVGSGILFASFAAFDQPAFSRTWIQLGMVVGLLYIIGIVADLIDADAVFQVVVGLGGGILAPAWAIWLALQLKEFDPLPPDPDKVPAEV